MVKLTTFQFKDKRFLLHKVLALPDYKLRTYETKTYEGLILVYF